MSSQGPDSPSPGGADWTHFRDGRDRFFAARERESEIYRLKQAWNAPEPVGGPEGGDSTGVHPGDPR